MRIFNQKSASFNVVKIAIFMSLLAYQASIFAAVVVPQASATAANLSPTMSLFKMCLGLLVVLFILFGITWGFKRLGLVNHSVTSASKVISNISVGTRERVVVLEIAGKWVVVGVAPGRVNAITTLDAPASSHTNNSDSYDTNLRHSNLNNPNLNNANASWLAAAQKLIKPYIR